MRHLSTLRHGGSTYSRLAGGLTQNIPCPHYKMGFNAGLFGAQVIHEV
jgi:hypothetical protein